MNGASKLCSQLARLESNIISDDRSVRQAGEYVRTAAVLGVPAVTGYLRDNIFLDVTRNDDDITATVYTPVEYGWYVEFGTGPKGEANHEGISPEVQPVYTQEPWWIHESQIDPSYIERYHWKHIDTENGRFYLCYGQAAQPFMYPALADNIKEVTDILRRGFYDVVKDSL